MSIVLVDAVIATDESVAAVSGFCLKIDVSSMVGSAPSSVASLLKVRVFGSKVDVSSLPATDTVVMAESTEAVKAFGDKVVVTSTGGSMIIVESEAEMLALDDEVLGSCNVSFTG